MRVCEAQIDLRGIRVVGGWGQAKDVDGETPETFREAKRIRRLHCSGQLPSRRTSKHCKRLNGRWDFERLIRLTSLDLRLPMPLEGKG